MVRSSSVTDNKVSEQTEHHSLWHSGLHFYIPVQVSRLTFVTNNTHRSIRIGPPSNGRGWPDRSWFILHPCGCASFSREHMVISMYRKVCTICMYVLIFLYFFWLPMLSFLSFRRTTQVWSPLQRPGLQKVTPAVCEVILISEVLNLSS